MTTARQFLESKSALSITVFLGLAACTPTSVEIPLSAVPNSTLKYPIAGEWCAEGGLMTGKCQTFSYNNGQMCDKFDCWTITATSDSTYFYNFSGVKYKNRFIDINTWKVSGLGGLGVTFKRRPEISEEEYLANRTKYGHEFERNLKEQRVQREQNYQSATNALAVLGGLASAAVGDADTAETLLRIPERNASADEKLSSISSVARRQSASPATLPNPLSILTRNAADSQTVNSQPSAQSLQPDQTNTAYKGLATLAGLAAAAAGEDDLAQALLEQANADSSSRRNSASIGTSGVQTVAPAVRSIELEGFNPNETCGFASPEAQRDNYNIAYEQRKRGGHTDDLNTFDEMLILARREASKPNLFTAPGEPAELFRLQQRELANVMGHFRRVAEQVGPNKSICRADGSTSGEAKCGEHLTYMTMVYLAVTCHEFLKNNSSRTQSFTDNGLPPSQNGIRVLPDTRKQISCSTQENTALAVSNPGFVCGDGSPKPAFSVYLNPPDHQPDCCRDQSGDAVHAPGKTRNYGMCAIGMTKRGPGGSFLTSDGQILAYPREFPTCSTL